MIFFYMNTVYVTLHEYCLQVILYHDTASQLLGRVLKQSSQLTEVTLILFQ